MIFCCLRICDTMKINFVVQATWLSLGLCTGLLATVGAASNKFRPGSPTMTHTCDSVRGVPQELRSADVMRPEGLDDFYQKYTEAYGIPVLGSSQAPDDALKRACYLLRFVLADHAPVRRMVYRLAGRFAVIAPDETPRSIPEHKAYTATRDVPAYGATWAQPASSARATNLLCDPSDRFKPESIAVHELGHLLHRVGAEYAIPGWNDRLVASFQNAKANNLWTNTYALTDYAEYFAEGMQSYFNENWCVPSPDGNHNSVCTRVALKTYDRTLHDLIKELFPCGNHLRDRCNTTRALDNDQQLTINCVTYTEPACLDDDARCVWATRGYEGKCDTHPEQAYWLYLNCRRSCNTCRSTDPNCKDNEERCAWWAATGECENNSGYMHPECAYSCQQC